jgi:hypothetical protein
MPILRHLTRSEERKVKIFSTTLLSSSSGRFYKCEFVEARSGNVSYWKRERMGSDIWGRLYA